jgi:predicted pyridoxine 5'-phosphate oxidase superfamily flavin-nucleotide-binding protein
VVEGDKTLLHCYRARQEQVALFTVTAWDVNCPQHIPQRFEAVDVQAAIEFRNQRIAALEAEVEGPGGGPLRVRE